MLICYFTFAFHQQLDHLAIQSGGFNTEFLSKISPRDLLAGAAGGALCYACSESSMTPHY